MTKTNNLKVRRIDLLEQLEQRYAWMTKEKEKWEQADLKYRNACDQYYADQEAWNSKIYEAVKDALLKVKKINYEFYDAYGRDEHYTGSMSVRLSHADLVKIIGPAPKKPKETVERPRFLETRYNSYRSQSDIPTLYGSVYQAIQLLKMSDDETVSASMYQLALEAL